MQNEDWDIFRYIVAVADSGSAIAAAKKLGVNGSTVLRRISKFENERGVLLFDRRQSGFTPTPHCDSILNTARQIQDSIAVIDLGIASQDVRFEGLLTVTTTDTFLETVLADILLEFNVANPGITIEVTVTNERLSLTRRDADVAIRASRKPPEHLFGQCVSPVAFAVYGPASIAAKLPALPSIKDLQQIPWVGTGQSNSGSPVSGWMERNIPTDAVKIKADTFPGMQACIEQGGVGVLPCCLGDHNDRLHRLLSPIDEMETSLWVLVHPDLRRSAKISAFTKHVSKRLRAKTGILIGQRIMQSEK